MNHETISLEQTLLGLAEGMSVRPIPAALLVANSSTATTALSLDVRNGNEKTRESIALGLLGRLPLVQRRRRDGAYVVLVNRDVAVWMKQSGSVRVLCLVLHAQTDGKHAAHYLDDVPDLLSGKLSRRKSALLRAALFKDDNARFIERTVDRLVMISHAKNRR